MIIDEKVRKYTARLLGAGILVLAGVVCSGTQKRVFGE